MSNDYPEPPRSDWADFALLSEASDPEEYRDIWGAVQDDENWRQLTEQVIVPFASFSDIPSPGPFDGAKAEALDSNVVFRWDESASEWTPLNTGTSANPVPGTSHYESLSTERADIVSGDLEAALSEASAGDTILLSQTTTHIVDAELLVDVADLTIDGGDIALADGVDDNLLRITADGVTLRNFKGDGNRANQTAQSGSVVHVEGSDFTAQNIIADNSARHGVYIDGVANNVKNPTLRGVRGDNNDRDLVSLEGPNLEDPTVDGAYGTNSANRGTVEIVDGVTGAVVEDVYGGSQSYVVSIEDHGNAGEDHDDIHVEHVRGESVGAFIAQVLSDLGHENITIADVTGPSGTVTDVVPPVDMENVTDLTYRDIRIVGYDSNYSIQVRGCEDVELNNCRGGENSATTGVVRIRNCDDVRVFGGYARSTDGHGMQISESDGAQHTGFLIHGWSASGCGKQQLEFSGDVATMSVVGSDATVTDNATNDTVTTAGNP